MGRGVATAAVSVGQQQQARGTRSAYNNLVPQRDSQALIQPSQRTRIQSNHHQVPCVPLTCTLAYRLHVPHTPRATSGPPPHS